VRRKLKGGLLAVLFAFSCASAPTLPGTWRGSIMGAFTTLDFRRDGTLAWTYPGGTVDARYATR
jgi:hypothetical protein